MNPTTTPVAPDPTNQPASPNEIPTPSSEGPAMSSPSPVTTTPVSHSKKRKTKLIAIIVAVLIVLLGGSAAAYFGVVVPNKPENLLKKAFTSLAQQTSFSTRGNIDLTTDGTTANMNVKMLHTNSEQKTFLLDTELTVMGIKLPVELRYVDQNAYIRFSDLTVIKQLAAMGGADEDTAALLDTMANKLTNQWVEVDKSTLEQANATCAIDGLFGLFNADTATASADLWQNEQHRFLSVKNATKDTVDGQKATKLEVAVDKDKLKAYAAKLQDVPAYQALNKCASSSQPVSVENIEETASSGTIETFNIWIGSDKRIKRIEIAVSATQDNQTSRANLDFTMLDQAVTVEKPTDAKSLNQLMREFYQQPFSDSSTFDPRSLSNSLSL